MGEVSLVKETEDRVIPPSDEVITIVDRTINDELKDAARKGKKRFAFDSALPPVKKAKATPSATLPHKMKNPKKVGIGSASAAMDAFVSESMTPSPNHEYQDESDSMQDGYSVSNPPLVQTDVVLNASASVHKACTYSATPGDASLVDDFYESQTIDYAKAKDASLRNLPNEDFLDQFNVNYARQACMSSELRLRYEHEIDQMERLEKKTCVVRLYGHVLELEAAVVVRVEELARLRVKNAELIGQVSDLETLLEARIKHGKIGRSLEKVESYDVDVKAKYLVAVKDLEDITFPQLEDLEALKDSPIELLMQLTVPAYYERGGSRVHGSWDCEIFLYDALAASRARFAYGSQPISSAPTVQALTVNASMTATSLILALSLLQVVLKAARDGSALTVVVS
ncbi:hypothetical protein Tco_0174490 [Tanacetum coccineum]